MVLLGKYGQELGITDESLKSFSMHIHPSKFTKGVALELFLHAKKKSLKIQWKDVQNGFQIFLSWICFLFPKPRLKPNFT